LFHTGGALGIYPSELSPLGRNPTRLPDGKDPPTVPLTGIPCTEVRGRLGEPQFLGLSFRESLATEVCLAHRPLDAPLGFALLGYLGKCLGRDFARPPLSRFASRARSPPPAPQSLDQHSPRPNRPSGKPLMLAQATPSGFWHRLRPRHSNGHHPGYVFTSHRVAHCCQPADALEMMGRSTGVVAVR
jgi:hypothetical protein